VNLPGKSNLIAQSKCLTSTPNWTHAKLDMNRVKRISATISISWYKIPNLHILIGFVFRVTVISDRLNLRHTQGRLFLSIDSLSHYPPSLSSNRSALLDSTPVLPSRFRKLGRERAVARVHAVWDFYLAFHTSVVLKLQRFPTPLDLRFDCGAVMIILNSEGR